MQNRVGQGASGRPAGLALSRLSGAVVGSPKAPGRVTTVQHLRLTPSIANFCP